MSAETLSVGIMATVVGMGVVFAILICLMFFIMILGKAVDSAEKKKQPKSAAPVAAAPKAAAAPAAVKTTGIDTKTVAAIMAAVSAASGRSMRELHFTSIKRAGVTNGAWGQSGVNEIISTRQSYI